MNRTKLIFAAAIMGIAGLAVAGHFDYQEAEASHARYCENVAIWDSEASRGIRPEHRTGHPDYNAIADKYCR